jgi:sugar lactone lactonase YvrE
MGIAVDTDRVYVSTSAGSPVHPNSRDERVFAYDFKGNLLSTRRIETMPMATMGLFGLAVDGNAAPTHRLYASDMNGRLLRLALNQARLAPEVVAEVPPPYSAGGWEAAMWNDIVFDSAGNAYITDDKPRLWRITPGGEPSIWFEDARLAGLVGFSAGPAGARIDPEGRFLYFTVSASAIHPGDGVVFRLPLVDHPSAMDLEEVHRFAAGGPPGIQGLAFGSSGRLYVSLGGTNEIAVLDTNGREVRRISSPLFDTPVGLAFLGRSLLVTNANFFRPDEHPDHWQVLRVFVDETGLPLNRPTSLP